MFHATRAGRKIRWPMDSGGLTFSRDRPRRSPDGCTQTTVEKREGWLTYNLDAQ